MRLVLVHGGWQGGWAWDAVAAQLREAGHDVAAPTLKGSEEGDVDRSGVSLSTMADDLIEQVRALDWSNITLVAHSGGGPMIQLVAAAMPDRVRKVVFMHAWVLNDGEKINDVLPGFLVDEITKSANESADNTVDIDRDLWKSRFMQDADLETLGRTIDRLVPCPFGWLDERIRLRPSWMDGIEAAYIFLADDQSIPNEPFRNAASRLPNVRLIECPGSHEALLTRPTDVANALVQAIE